MTYLDPGFWSRHLREVFATQVESLARVVLARLVPTFEGLEAEAEVLADAEYQRLAALPGDDSADLSSLAEEAHSLGLDFYLELTGLRQGMLNLFAASLYHLFEQQMMEFHRRQVLHPAEEDDPRLWKAEIFDERLKEAGIDVTTLSSWRMVGELRLVANVAKHGDGRSAHELFGRRPDLFVAPELRGMRGPINPGAGTRSPRVRTPILGCDLYVTEDDVRSYAAAVATFWRELADVMLAAR